MMRDAVPWPMPFKLAGVPQSLRTLTTITHPTHPPVDRLAGVHAVTSQQALSPPK